MVAAWLAVPSWAAVSLTLERLSHPTFEADGVRIAFDAGRKGVAEIRIDRLLLAGIEYQALVLRCADFVLDLRHVDCPRGEIMRSDARGKDRPPLPFAFSYRLDDGRLELALNDTEVIAWSPLVKRLRSWRPAGTVDLHLVADRRQAELRMAARKLGFGNKDGTIAGEGIGATLTATAQRRLDGWSWTARFEWPQGEIYRAPWYRNAGVVASAEGTLDAQALSVELARLDLAGIGAMTASWRWDRALGETTDWGFVTERLDLATAFREWLQPWLDQSAFPPVKASGHARFAASWSRGQLRSLYAGLEDASLEEGSKALAFHGIQAHIPWDRGRISEAEFSVAGGRLGDLPLGDFRVPATLSDGEARLEKLSVPLLDGRLLIDELRAWQDDDQWRGRFAGGIESVSMAKVAAALKLPAMAGSLTARIPAAEYGNHVLRLGGDLAIEVFDGDIRVTRLEVLDPLAATRRFVAEVAARNIDLGLLTQTFSFGSMEGRLDADLGGLELKGWQPVRFDARVASSPGDHRRSISRGALRDISALGGVAGALAVQKSPANLFNSFDYERIGFRCRLANDACHADGIEAAGDGYRVVQGRGLPRVDVIGYNRRIDWPLLVSRLRAVIAGKSKAVIE